MEEKGSALLARGKFRAVKGGFSQDASGDARARHLEKRGGGEREERLRRLLKKRPAGMWAVGAPLAPSAAGAGAAAKPKAGGAAPVPPAAPKQPAQPQAQA